MSKLDRSFRSEKDISGLADDFSSNGIGIVHFGTGAFHRAHQAVYTNDVLTKHGGDWRILGVSLQSTKTADQLNSQEGVYTLVTRGFDETRYSLIKSISSVEAAVRGTEKIIDTLTDVRTHIVSMTVTEKAYGVIRETGAIDTSHPSIKHDLENPSNPKGIIGFIVHALALRKANSIPPFTVLCCDNLPQNGDLVKSAVLDFAISIGNSELAAWIEETGAFPNSMVDRITPATTSDLLVEVSDYLGVADIAPIETEAFSQWVVEDKFVTDRPRWEDVGVIFVDDVAPYEKMKLRMLNGSHSFIAYSGFLCGKKFVRDVMADDSLSQLVKSYMQAASDTLEPLKGMSFATYAEQLIERFKNPNIAHETYQIAMDGSQKLPQRIFEPALHAAQNNNSMDMFALATAAWIRYCTGFDENGNQYSLRDPREDELLNAYSSGNNCAENICANFLNLPELMPVELSQNEIWKASLTNYLRVILEEGMHQAARSALTNYSK